MEVERLLLLPPCCNLLHLTLDFEAEFYTACYPNIGLRAAIAAHIHSVAAYELKTLSHADDKLNDTITERLDNTINRASLLKSTKSSRTAAPTFRPIFLPVFSLPSHSPSQGSGVELGPKLHFKHKKNQFLVLRMEFLSRRKLHIRKTQRTTEHCSLQKTIMTKLLKFWRNGIQFFYPLPLVDAADLFYMTTA